MDRLVFDDGFEVELEGVGGTLDELTEYYQQYLEPGPVEDPAVSCAVEPFTPDPDVSLGDPNLYYGREGDQFVVENTAKTLRIDRDWTGITCTPDTSKNGAVYLLEYEMRKRYAASGRALVHASGVEIDGSTLVFPAWRHTGKTNLMLSLLAEFGGGYLSDDRVWVHDDGRVSGYDLPVNMMPYNIKTFSDLAIFSRKERLAARASNVARWYAQRSDGFLPKAASFTNIFYLEPTAAKLLTIDELLPNAEFSHRTSADAAVLLQTSPSASRVELSEASRAAARRAFVSSSHYEWNKELEEYCTVFDALFPEEDHHSEHVEFVDREAAIFESFLEDVAVFKLTIPREERWEEKGIGEQAIDRITDVLEAV